MNVTMQMIVGPGETTRYLDRTLRLASRWASQILIVGDRCDPDTWDACKVWATEAVMHDRADFHESDLRNAALRLCDQHTQPGDLVVALDADEELRPLTGPGDPRPMLDELAGDHAHEAWQVHYWHLWDPDGTVHRTDGYWQPSVGLRIYRHQPGLQLRERALGIPPVPDNLPAGSEPRLGIAHWGYARPHDRARKHEYYMRVDGGRYHLRTHLESIVAEATVEPVPCS